MEQAEINKAIVEGRKFRLLIDTEPKNWTRFTGWTVTDRPFKKATPIIKNKKTKENQNNE